MIDQFSGKYRFLSNYYCIRFCYKGNTYRSAEHAYQAEKCKFLNDAGRIRLAASPVDAKRLGQKVALKDGFMDNRISIMEDIVQCKFVQNSSIAKLLIETGNETLVERNWWNDTFWGICNGVGRNNLGIILMKVRNNLISLTNK